MSEEIKRWKGALEIISRKKDPNESCRAKTKSTERERKKERGSDKTNDMED